MSRKQPPPPFAPLHRDYDEALKAVLVAAGMMQTWIETALSLDLIDARVRADAEKVVADYERAWYGERKEPKP